MLTTTETELINARIDFFGRGRSTRDIVRSILDEWRNGSKKHVIQNMLDADKYFRVENVGIQSKARGYTDGSGNRQNNNTLSNAQIPSAFLRNIIEQQVNYAVGKPLVLSVSGPIADTVDEATGETIVDPKIAQYLDLWQTWLNDDRMETIVYTVYEAENKGIGWVYVTIFEDALEIYDMSSEQIYPAWADKQHKELDAIVRDYPIVVYINSERTEIKKVEFWAKDVVERFIDAGGLLPDADSVSIDAHMRTEDQAVTWGRVPFIALRSNKDELPILNVIRQQIDNYDRLQSKSVDALLDDVDPVLAVEGMSPEMRPLMEDRERMKNSRIMSVDVGGKVYYVLVNPNIDAVQQKLEHLKKDIREFARSVDVQDIRFGSNPSGVALKSMYQDLDTATNALEKGIRTFFKNLKYFFDRWLEFSGIGTATEWEQYALTVRLDRDMMINTNADIQETVMLASTGASQETIDNWNPAVESHAIEQERRKREAQEARSGGADAIFDAEVQKALNAKLQHAHDDSESVQEE